MKYLKTRQDFLTGIVEYKEKYQMNSDDFNNSTLVREVLENDITWGGSLLGRLINSTIRKVVIGVKTLGVKPLLAKLKEQMKSLEGDYINGEPKVVLQKGVLFTALKQIKQAAENDEPVEIFLGNGSKDSGLINLAISSVEKIEDFPDKEQFIDKLEQFRKDLEGLKENTPEEQQQEEESTDDFKFLNFTLKVLESIIKLVPKIPTVPNKDKSDKQETALQIGKIYTHTNKEGVKKKVKLISLSNQVKPGVDRKFLTTDDVKGSELKSDNLAFVEFLNPDGTSLKKTMAVDISQISESIDGIIYESMQDPAAKLALNKLSIYTDNSKIREYINTLQSIITDFKSEPGKEVNSYSWSGVVWNNKGSLKSKINQLGSQIVANLSTVGKPFSPQELIKEEIQFNDLAKSISLFCKPILSFKENKDLISKMGELSEGINSIIDSFESVKSDQETGKKLENFRLVSYQGFLGINEADEEILNDRTESDTNEKLSAYNKNFDENDEKKWFLDEKEQLSMNSKFQNIKINIDTTENPDPIVRIANIFGDAYRLFTTPQIPSGRPNGRVSQKTWREYKYLGKGTGKWSANEAPDGPFAIRSVYQKWEKGVMQIIENPDMRKIFANPNLSINGNPGAGQTLFKFMNDMIQDEALQDYDGARRRLLLKYFNIEDSKGLNEAKPTIEGKKPKLEDKAESGDTRFVSSSDVRFTTQSDLNKRYGGYFLLDCESDDNSKLWILMYVVGRIDNDPKGKIIFKYQIGGNDLLKYLEKAKLKSPKDDVVKNLKPNQEIFIGVSTNYNKGEFEFESQDAVGFFKNKNLAKKKYKVKASYSLLDANTFKPVVIKDPEAASNRDKNITISNVSNKLR